MPADQEVIVFVVDDDASVRTGLSRLLKSAGHVVEAFASAEDFLARKSHKGLGCIVLDLCMPNLSGIGLQEKLAESTYELPVIFLSGLGSIPTTVQAMKGGAVDFLTKPVDEEVLLGTVQAAIERHREIVATRGKNDLIRRHLATLTSREEEVMRCVISGALNKQIAGYLGITEKTVKVHRGRVMEKMGITSVAELVRECAAVGIEPYKVTF